MSHNRQFSGSWRALKKLSYVGLIWMSICFIAFRFTQSDINQVRRPVFTLTASYRTKWIEIDEF